MLNIGMDLIRCRNRLGWEIDAPPPSPHGRQCRAMGPTRYQHRLDWGIAVQRLRDRRCRERGRDRCLRKWGWGIDVKRYQLVFVLAMEKE